MTEDGEAVEEAEGDESAADGAELRVAEAVEVA